MRLIRFEEKTKRYFAEPTVVVLGTFDGVHRGHAALIEKAKRIGRLHGFATLVYTFFQHPQHVLATKPPLTLLTTPDEKVLAMASLTPEGLVMRSFEPSFAALPPEDFVLHLLQSLGPAHVVVGENYSFGQGGAGKAADLRVLTGRLGVRTHILPPVLWGGAAVSSTRVREAVDKGDMELAALLLGRPYHLRGHVESGKRFGRRIGFPTANLPFPREKALPPHGVYIASARVEQNDYPAVLNIGRHPTLPEGPPTIEVFLLETQMDLYGKRMDVSLRHFLRPEQRFADVEALRAQIGRDVEAAKAYFDR